MRNERVSNKLQGPGHRVNPGKTPEKPAPARRPVTTDTLLSPDKVSAQLKEKRFCLFGQIQNQFQQSTFLFLPPASVAAATQYNSCSDTASAACGGGCSGDVALFCDSVRLPK